MKILQLELVAFGLFTDKILDFSVKKSNLHLISGANEAGKSTMCRALHHLFFGIPSRTPDNYLHANKNLRIGGKLINTNGEELLCYRRKGSKNTLLDVNNKPLNEKHLQAFIGGMTKTQFTALCCFDHKDLRQGGEDLLKGGGDVGESLFEAGTGSLKVHDVLARLDAEKNNLFKRNARKPLLNKAIIDYQNAKKRIQNYSLSANQYHEHDKKLAQALQVKSDFNQKLQNHRANQHRLQRIQRTRPRLRRYQELTAEWKTLTQIILLPDDAISKRMQANMAWRTAQTQEQQAKEVIVELQEQIQAITIYQALLAQKATIDNLRGRLGSHQKAARDLPGVRTEMRTVENDARALSLRIYPKLALQDVPKYMVTNPQRERIKQLADEYPALFEKQTSISKRLQEVAQELVQQEDALKALPHSPDLTPLRAILTRICKYGDLEETYAKNEIEVRSLKNKAKVTLKQLGGWVSLEALEEVVLPKIERIDSFERRFNEQESDRRRIKERLLEARQRHERSTKNKNALSWGSEIPTEEGLFKVRKIRQSYWQQIKTFKKSKNSKSAPLFDDKTKAYFSGLKKGETLNFDEPTSNKKDDLYHTFEKSMLEVDELSDRLRREASRVAEYSILLAEQKSAKNELEQQTKKWHQQENLLTDLKNEWEKSWKPVGIKPWSAAEMRSWLNDSLNLRDQANMLRERCQQLEEGRQLIAKLCQELTQALKPFGKTLTCLSDLIEQGNAYITEMMKQQREREHLQLEINTLIKEQHRAQNVNQQTSKDFKQWKVDWIQAISPLHLPDDTPPETVRNVLNDLDKVLNKIEKAKDLGQRVKLMERDATTFQQEVASLVKKIAPELVKKTLEESVPALSKRLSQAEKDLTRFEQLQQSLLAQEKRLANANQQVQLNETHLQALQEQAHCSDIAALEKAEKASVHKKEIQTALTEVEEQLLEQGDGLSVTELAKAAAEVDIDELPGLLQIGKEHIQELEEERSRIDQAIGELRTLLKQMDGNSTAAQAAEEAQFVLAEVQELSERYMQIHLAASVLRKSIERYREQNQGPLVKRASELFQRLTLKQFSGLKTDYIGHNDQPVLVGIRNGVTILATDMSDGTRDQLYLALRLASIERYIEKKNPIPLILDDILINFDDERSKATLEILGELSQRTQILFLTHHSRLLEMAQKAVPKKYLVVHHL